MEITLYKRLNLQSGTGIEPENIVSIREKTGLKLQEKLMYDEIPVLIYSIEHERKQE
jgi:hypothetical protein